MQTKMVGLQDFKTASEVEISPALIQESLAFLRNIIQIRIQQYFGADTPPWEELSHPDNFSAAATIYLKKINPKREEPMDFAEYLIFILALSPHIHPGFIGNCIAEVLEQAGDFPEIGGIKNGDHRIFQPTGETALFLVAGKDLQSRFTAQQLFSSTHWFAETKTLALENPKNHLPATNGRILLNPDIVELLTTGVISRPGLSSSFPAEYISTQLEWEDLILNPHTKEQIQELQRWIIHNDTLLHDWEMSKKIKPGFRALFYGPPGTGKTLTASLLGKYTQRDVFRVDLSMVVSKFIGETEKNLSSLFDKAQHKNWILFFDEADALFGKRTNVRDAHDKYANQEVSYLLQRVESFPGMVILASNYKSNIDEAFTRRFQSIIHFPMPGVEERFRLWQLSFPKAVTFSDEVDFEQLAEKYELSGSNIMNIVQYSCLYALERGGKEVQLKDIIQGIRKEFTKEGKLV